MATTEVNARVSALPPGAANVEDDVKAWEALERRAKWKLLIVSNCGQSLNAPTRRHC